MVPVRSVGCSWAAGARAGPGEATPRAELVLGRAGTVQQLGMLWQQGAPLLYSWGDFIRNFMAVFPH